jgi:hypothetical protein
MAGLDPIGIRISGIYDSHRFTLILARLGSSPAMTRMARQPESEAFRPVV